MKLQENYGNYAIFFTGLSIDFFIIFFQVDEHLGSLKLPVLLGVTPIVYLTFYCWLGFVNTTVFKALGGALIKLSEVSRVWSERKQRELEIRRKSHE